MSITEESERGLGKSRGGGGVGGQLLRLYTAAK